MIRNLIFSAVGVAVATYLLPSAEIVGDTTQAYLINLGVIVIVMAIVNTIIKPIITLITLPINIITLGLFSLFINGFMVWIADKVLSGFEVGGWWGAFLFGIILSLVHIILPDGDKYSRSNLLERK